MGISQNVSVVRSLIIFGVILVLLGCAPLGLHGEGLGRLPQASHAWGREAQGHTHSGGNIKRPHTRLPPGLAHWEDLVPGFRDIRRKYHLPDLEPAFQQVIPFLYREQSVPRSQGLNMMGDFQGCIYPNLQLVDSVHPH